MNKKIRILILIAAMLMIAAATIGCAAPEAKQTGENVNKFVLESTDEPDKNTLSISATGKIKLMPDVAYVTIGVITENKDAKAAQDKNREKMAAIVEALEAAGLTEVDMQTVNYYVGPLYNYKDGRETTGYEVQNILRLTINDTSKVGEYVDIAALNGANTAHPIQFALKDRDTVYADALNLAMKNAVLKAQALADAGGFKIAGPINVSEGGEMYPRNAYDEYAKVESVMADEAEMPIAASELEVSANINVVYEIID